jgi:glyoxylase-like metal-dependent hydrolase (beta-lactamase superfamily II)
MPEGDGNRRGFIITPFLDEVEWLTELIRGVGDDAGVEFERADDIFAPGVIINQILTAIDESDVIVAVTTGRNPNVFFELGYAWLRHRPILLAETTDDMPFDVASWRHLLYGDGQPCADPEALDGFAPLAVVQTHGHWDHVRAWDDLAEDPGLAVWGHAGDADLFPNPLDRELLDGDAIAIGELEAEVIHTPGHTPGSIHLLVRGEERPHLFTGDSLFPGGVGNTWGDAELFRQLLDGVKERIFDQLPDETWVYPGHGDDTTLGEERPKVPEWRERGW